ncbi:glycosyltransferase [Paenarthrobacter nitroguajacolicus]|jgi:rhamnopyranosyl-N-acetylglucosaminyl-diphospho-decaprenol beta-1,3/1,4-galactofuranosyltransferase|uniref:glycosyltransferase n=1 Tax=Paenarthrobacter nitroguajacolicus TaxID=211146 RepID=UPI0015BB4096|nr:glycosyltransferase [Paenarthrobacter nitroguajacolicus]NWL32481.1 glycosyl transferase [Paenarthrobacter nitroguajacolicus]
MTSHPVVVAVVVTYNRRELLQTTLEGIVAGTRVPDAVVIVDNASTDGTAEFLQQYQSPVTIDVVSLNTNVGGAGGFVVGMERAVLDHGADHVWIMDDDTEPQANALREALDVSESYQQETGEAPAFIASRVVWTDGRDHPMNRMRPRMGASEDQRSVAARLGATQIRSASFVSVLIRAGEIKQHGLPIADYFIWNDDLEYTARISRRGTALTTNASVANHHTKVFGDAGADPGPRFYYEVRNKLWVYTRSNALAPWEKVLFTGASLRNWTRTIAASPNRKVLLAGLLKGLRHSLKAPRSNAQVLDGIYALRNVQGPVR